MRLTLVIISSIFLLSGCSLWNKYFAKTGVTETSKISEKAAVNATSGLGSADIDRGLGGIGETKQETTIIQQNPIRPGKNEILIKYRNKSSEVILSLDPRDNNVQIDVSKAQSAGDMFSESSIPLNSSGDMSGRSSGGAQGSPDGSGDNEKDMLARAQSSFYNGDYQKSLQQVNSSINTKPNAEAYALKGSIYYMLGNLALARKNWTNSLRLDSNIQGVRQMLNIIGN